MMSEDPDYIAKLEKAIQEKYGKDAIDNPKKFWNQEKEKKHLEQLKHFYKIKKSKDVIKVKKKGFFVSKDILEKDSERQCPVCDEYSFNQKDDLYMNKYKCCFKCYVQYVEGREERWKTGWRPNQ
jgi:hypothetical protein